MVYKIKEEKAEELKNGRTIKYISDKCGCTRDHLSKLFLGKRNCTKSLAFLLVLISKGETISTFDMDSKISEYFDEID